MEKESQLIVALSEVLVTRKQSLFKFGLELNKKTPNVFPYPSLLLFTKDSLRLDVGELTEILNVLQINEVNTLLRMLPTDLARIRSELMALDATRIYMEDKEDSWLLSMFSEWLEEQGLLDRLDELINQAKELDKLYGDYFWIEYLEKV